MKTIYIVEGTTGAYSDRYDWFVKAFTSKVKAKELADELNCAANGLFDALDAEGISVYDMNDPDYSYIKDRFPDLKKDSEFSMDYTGTGYIVSECELEG